MPPATMPIYTGGNDAGMREAIKASIKRYGHHVMSVLDLPPFAYTVGNAGLGLPELLLVGLSPDVSGRLLTVLSTMQVKNGHSLLGDVDLGGVVPCKLVAVKDLPRVQRKYTCWVDGFFGEGRSYGVTQVVVPDSKGRFPGDPECRAPWADQVLL